jgi:hypothetical protein
MSINWWREKNNNRKKEKSIVGRKIMLLFQINIFKLFRNKKVLVKKRQKLGKTLTFNLKFMFKKV